ncbi:MAG TPA: PIN domain-containing protein [Methylomusa anaerophila]|nr:PIN domain-containing protein [Methylomusa anaerophila]HML90622.1 PIN domain-containing protein [Methylomusa anaerophila]
MEKIRAIYYFPQYFQYGKEVFDCSSNTEYIELSYKDKSRDFILKGRADVNIVLDTNIFIYREDNAIPSNKLTELLRVCAELNIKTIIHPSSIEDLRRDKNEERKKIMLSKLSAYPILSDPPLADNDQEFIDTVGVANSHDTIDNNILYSVYRNAVDFLITEDKGIYRKARKIGLEDRVFDIEEAIKYLKKYFLNENVYQPLAIKVVHLYHLDLNDKIFNSLKQDYPGFELWWRKKSREGTKARVNILEDGSLGAILIWKVEREAIASQPPLPIKKRLKISTFKVTNSGFKIGELFLKMSVEYAMKNEIGEVYLTHFTVSNDELVRLIEDFGFYRVAKLGEEDVYLKNIIVTEFSCYTELSPVEISRKYYPSFYDGEDVKKFIVPILPKYHQKLFVEIAKQDSLFGADEFCVEGNTIKKAYLCHSQSKKMEAGDILLFYESRTAKGIRAIGIIENVYYRVQDIQEIIRLVGKRSVYKVKDIERIALKPTTVIIFRWHFYLPNFISYLYLVRNRILSGPPQSILEISHEKYELIKRGGGLDERFTVNQASVCR